MQTDVGHGNLEQLISSIMTVAIHTASAYQGNFHSQLRKLPVKLIPALRIHFITVGFISHGASSISELTLQIRMLNIMCMADRAAVVISLPPQDGSPRWSG